MYSLLYLVPKNWLSRVVGWIVRHRWPFGLHTRIRDQFIRHFHVDVSEAEHPLADYPTLGGFFIRRLRAGARPLAAAPLVSPVDGMLTQRGLFETGESNPGLMQIKGIRYSLQSLLAEGWEASAYAGGAFLTIYLAPWNYHRIHSPARGRVVRARHIAGALWPVNGWSVNNIADLFVRNDRVFVEMEGEEGRFIVAMIGATNVGRTTLSFCSELVGNSCSGSGIRDWSPLGELALAKGAELGCFEMGSTVVLILDSKWAARLKPGLQGSESLPMRVGTELSA